MPWIVLAVMLGPVAAGLIATVQSSFGHLPAIDARAFSLDPWRDALAWPGLPRSIVLTVSTGAAATGIALAAALAFGVTARRTGVLRALETAIAPILATPHAALAIGTAFLLAPSGWLARLIAATLTGWTVPPDLATVQDPHGLALIAGLVIKETPYLVLAILAALPQADAARAMRAAAALGYGPWRAWLLVVLPRLWPQLRLPVMAVLAYALSVVDVALVLGPGNPPTLAVQVLRLLSDPDLTRWLAGSATALLLAAIVLAAIGMVVVMEIVAARLGRAVARRGRRGGNGRIWDGFALGTAALLGAASLGALMVLASWSIAAAWPFPTLLPSTANLAVWRSQAAVLLPLVGTTAAIAAAATLAALALTVGALDHERRGARPPARAGLLLYVPLLLPQLVFLFGLQMLLVRLRLDGTILAVVWAHLVFVLPYVWLALAGPFRELDPRLARTAASLGVPPWRVLLRVTLPLLMRPLLAAGAVGFAVSAGLYLPTIFAGAGRVATLTTEAVTLAAGSDRRVLGAVALTQAALPLAAFALAVMLPEWRARRRRGLAVAA